MSTPPPIHPPHLTQPGNAASPVPNYMVWSIAITIVSLCVCCIVGTIPGIVAIVFSSKVNGALDRGDFAEAGRASANARLWCWITTGLCVLGLLLNIVFMATGGMAEYMQAMQQLQGAG
ncbi:MAG TPA: CD225/dispanin family protein [Lysobacter sp.]